MASLTLTRPDVRRAHIRPEVPAGPATIRSVQFRAALYVFGTLVLSLGVALTLVADLGLGPADVFIGVVAKAFGMGHGTASSLFIAAMVVAGLALGARPGPGTIITIVVLGPAINVAETALEEIVASDLLVVRALLGVGGVVVVCAGVGMIICAEVGRGATELLVDRVAERTAMRTPTVRTVFESLLVVSGVALSGPIGPITLLTAVSIGPGIVVAVRQCDRILSAGIPEARIRRIRHRVSRLR